MSLRDSVQEIVEDITKDLINYDDASSYLGQTIKNQLIGYCRQIKSALKASESNPQPAAPPNGMITMPDGTQGYHDPIGRFHSLKKPATQEIKEDAAGVSFLELTGGGADNTMKPFEGPMPPVGAKTLVNGQVYVYKGAGRAEYSEEETEKLKQTPPKEVAPAGPQIIT